MEVTVGDSEGTVGDSEDTVVGWVSVAGRRERAGEMLRHRERERV